MKKVLSSTKVDLSEEKAIGYEIVDALREEFPEIPRNCRCTRGHAWSRVWYLTYYLELDVTSAAQEYMDSIEPENYDLYWDYINDFRDTCAEIVSKYRSKAIQAGVTYYGENSGPARNRSDNAVLTVYCMNKPVR